MSHFAEVDQNNIVLRVLVGDNNMPDEGHGWFVENLGGTWVQTSYNGKIRKNFAAIGYTYDEHRDAFIPPRPFASWTLDEEACQWQAPVPRPRNGMDYVWNEDKLSWESLDE
jgi:hypothetical protein